MEEGTKTWMVLIVAGLMVISIGAVFYIGGENEADLPTDVDIWLTYQASGHDGGTELNGTFVCYLNIMDEGGSSGGIEINMTGNLLDHSDVLLMGGLSSGYYLDDPSIETIWGMKHVERSIQATLSYPGGICINFGGAHTGLIYKMEIIAPEVRATFVLVGTSIADMGSFDVRSTCDSDRLIKSHYAEDYQGMNDQFFWRLIEPRNDESCSVHINSTNSSVIGMDEEHVRNILDGGEFQYNSEMSVFGNGSTEFVIDEGRVFLYSYPTTQSYMNRSVQLEIDVFDR